MPPKTLHLTNSWHETSGGVATFYRALIKTASQRGHSIRLLVPGESDHVEKVGDFARIYHVKCRRAPLNPRYRMIYPTQFLPIGSALQRILVAERPDLVEICDKYTLNYFGAALRRRLLNGVDFRPIVVGLSCERMDDNFRSYLGLVPLAQTFCAAYMRWAYFPFFDHHIANSPYTAEELRNASRGHLVRRHVWIRPMGVNTGHFSPSRRSSEARLRLLKIPDGRDNSVLLVYVGRLVPEKNLSLLFHLLLRLVRAGKHDYRLIVAGDGIDRRKWETFCQTHVPGRATFLGHLTDADQLADLLANADAFIHPNPREPFGIAPLEAMASGLPLIAPDVGGIAFYAGTENAWISAAHVEGFAFAIDEMLSNDSERIRRAKNALQTAEQYRWENVAASFLDLYADLHATAMGRSGVLPSPAFSSTPAENLRLAWLRGVSESVEKIFHLVQATPQKGNHKRNSVEVSH
jgi:alpha-1,6-mannosyltransferase